MDFFEFQDHVEEQEILLKYIIQKFQDEEFVAKKERTLFLDEKKIYIMKSGILLKEDLRTRAGRLYSSYEVIDTLAHENNATLFYGKVAIFDKVRLFDELERHGLLSNFIYLLWKNKLTELNYLETSITSPVKQRIINFISKYSTKTSNRCFLPKFVSIKLIAACCLCSTKQVSRILNEMEKEGIISPLNKKPIYITDLNYIEKYGDNNKQDDKSILI
ncbi:helix-turn-helix domain-containing protein [Listeria sp. PSOL-1]|uniref:helix-turn-helix domain-containing protein n=1 Tax=Listeria sp. PSOL-1 TaxID=1844999 RepID=UPI0013D6D5A2|nr:helix-turn-helix domain-containing protein [Listeria sp. PSOL-1]